MPRTTIFLVPIALLALGALSAVAEDVPGTHGIAMHGDLKYRKCLCNSNCLPSVRRGRLGGGVRVVKGPEVELVSVVPCGADVDEETAVNCRDQECSWPAEEDAAHEGHTQLGVG